MRLLVQFEKKGSLRYISHLDLLRNLQRTLLRMDVPIRFSQGFNPHPILSFAQALSLGMESEGEYFEVGMQEKVEENTWIQTFNAHSVEGLKAVQCRWMEKNEKSAMAQVKAASYLLPLGAKEKEILAPYLQQLLQKDKIPYQRETKKGIREDDMRPKIYTLECNEQGLYFLTACGNDNLRVEELLNAIQTLSNHKVPLPWHRVIRKNIYCDRSNPLIR